jgi:Protein of unknown function (DUF3124)
MAAALASCGPGERGRPAVTRPRAGGVEIETPAGGFQAMAGQTIYVPAYSSILTTDELQPFNLAVTLSVRNTDRKHPIIVSSVRYFDHDGKLIQDHLEKPLSIGPMAAVEFFVRESDTRGGFSASFLVEWLSETTVANPVIEAVMVGTASSRGVSFRCPGRVIETRGELLKDQ